MVPNGLYPALIFLNLKTALASLTALYICLFSPRGVVIDYEASPRRTSALALTTPPAP